MRTTLLIALLTTGVITSRAQVAGPQSANLITTAGLSGSVQSWSNEGSVQTSDDAYAVFGNLPAGNGTHTNYLVATDFGFNLPEGVTVQGIRVDIERSDPNGITADYSVRILRAGLIGSAERSTGIAYPVNDGFQSYGGSSDQWGESWSYKDIGNDNFGVAIAAQRNGAGITAGRIDAIRITVYYGFTTLPVNLVSFKAEKLAASVRLGWQSNSEQSLKSYTIERSGDGRAFYPLQQVTPQNSPAASYEVTDAFPLAGNSWYRLRIEDGNGDIKYSRIAPVSFSRYASGGLSPSLWTPGTDLSIPNPGRETLNIQFINGQGQVVAKTTTQTEQVRMPVIQHTGGMLYYRITGTNQRLVGTGALVVY